MFKVGFSGMAVLAALSLFAVSCASVESPGAPAAAPRAKIGVYIDKGARNIGAFRWIEIATRANDAEAVCIDCDAIRAGALDGLDMLIMPGGKASLEAEAMGAEGRAKLKSFIERGGGYIGTCAGCFLLMQPGSGLRKNYLDVIPYAPAPSGGHADLMIEFNGHAEDALGLKKGSKERIAYAGGPVLLPAKPAEKSDFRTIAVYHSDINATSAKKRPSFAGKGAMTAGTYGKGRVFASAVHPEMDVDDHYIIKRAFKYVLGRSVEWDYPMRREGALSVGFVCDDSFGLETAKFVQKLVTQDVFDIVPINKKAVANGILSHLDAVMYPDSAGSKGYSLCFGGENAALAAGFMARGGLVLAWGEGLKALEKSGVEGAVAVSGGEEALSRLEEFSRRPLAMTGSRTPKAPRPVKTAVFCDAGVCNFTIPEMLEFAPEYDMDIIGVEDVKAGKLPSYDLLVVPGGQASELTAALGAEGGAKIRDYILGGGKYYGICAGTYAILQKDAMPEKKRRSENKGSMGFIPFMDDAPRHCRGWAPTEISFTDEGLKAFPGMEKTRQVFYMGGPVMVPGKPVDGADFEVLATYDGQIVNTWHPGKVESMYGKAAVLGGTLGKGRVLASGPHPESDLFSMDIVQAFFRYLTGVKPTLVERPRRRGAKTLFVRLGPDRPSAEYFIKTALHDGTVDFHIGPRLDCNMLPHVDAVILPCITKEDVKDGLKSYIARGGKVVVVADTPARGRLAAELPGATLAGSCAEAFAAVR